MKEQYPDCPICLQSCIEDDLHQQHCCKQIFHKSCLNQWIGSCPTCRYQKNYVQVEHRFFGYSGYGFVEKRGHSTSPYYHISITESDYYFVRHTHFFFENLWEIK